MAIQPGGKCQTQSLAFFTGVLRLLSLSDGHLKRFSFIQVNFNPKPKTSRVLIYRQKCFKQS
jgi:hypothetical protein